MLQFVYGQLPTSFLQLHLLYNLGDTIMVWSLCTPEENTASQEIRKHIQWPGSYATLLPPGLFMLRIHIQCFLK
jgi:hypothetical protein